MRGLMMDEPLILSQLFERSRQVFARKPLATRVPGQPLFRYTYADFASRVERLAGGLAALGVQPGERVGTFAWNTHHHLEAYWAVPMMGAVLHTVNFRLSAQDVSYIVNHAADSVLLVGASVWPLLEPIRAELTTVRQIVIIRDTPDAEVPAGLLDYEDLLDLGQPGHVVAALRREHGLRHVLHVRHHRPPEGRRLLPPGRLPALVRHGPGRYAWPLRTRRHPAHGADVPRQRLVRPVRRGDGRRHPDLRRAGSACRATSWTSSSPSA